MKKMQKKDDRTSYVYKLTNPYVTLGEYNIRAVGTHQSASAYGYKYHKRNKRKKP